MSLNGENSCIMKMWKQKTWQHEITGVDGNTMLFGVNIFHYQWKATGQKVKVCDPLYNREYQFPVYTVVVNGFQSTPSTRRVTYEAWLCDYSLLLFQSTPSTRRVTWSYTGEDWALSNFNPHPPHGG